MRSAVHAALALVLAAATGCSADPGVTVAALDPPYGPVRGGSTTTIIGDGFESRPGETPLVLIGGREVPVVIVVDDDHLTVLTPPGTGPGDVDVRVVIGDRAARAPAGFRYSRGPVLTDATPHDVFHEAGTTRVHLRGTGFLDEGAGPPTLLVDGLAVEATVLRDDELSFVSPGGGPLREPTLELVNRRGGAILDRAFRYVPGRPGLLLFTSDSARFGVFVDPVDVRAVDLPRFGGFAVLSSVVRDLAGAYWALDFAGRVGALDVNTQQLVAPVETGRILSAIERVDGGYVAVDEKLRRLGRLDLATGVFTPLSAWEPGSCPCAVAYDGARVHVTSLEGDEQATVLRQVDPVSGAVGPPLPLTSPSFLVIDEMRFFGGVLYGLSGGELLTIDPTTGATATVPIPFAGAFALATYE